MAGSASSSLSSRSTAHEDVARDQDRESLPIAPVCPTSQRFPPAAVRGRMLAPGFPYYGGANMALDSDLSDTDVPADEGDADDRSEVVMTVTDAAMESVLAIRAQ